MQTNQRDLSPSRARKQAVSEVRRQAPGPAFSTERFLSFRQHRLLVAIPIHDPNAQQHQGAACNLRPTNPLTQ